jgi:hypothetical protein
MAGICKICLSPYRSEIERLWKQGVKRVQIYRKYKSLIPYEATESSFTRLMTRHWHHRHRTNAILAVSPKDSAQPVSRVAIEQFLQGVVDLGASVLQNTRPEDLKPKDGIDLGLRAGRLIFDARRVKLSEDAMALVMAEVFGPPLKVENGEVVEELGDGKNAATGTE